MPSAEFVVSGVAALGVGLGLVGGSDRLVVEEELARVGLVGSREHLHVDVDCPPRVPAGEDRPEIGDAVGVRHLDAAAERLALGALDPGVDAARVAMPDVDRGAGDRLAGVRIQDRDAQVER